MSKPSVFERIRSLWKQVLGRADNYEPSQEQLCQDLKADKAVAWIYLKNQIQQDSRHKLMGFTKLYKTILSKLIINNAILKLLTQLKEEIRFDPIEMVQADMDRQVEDWINYIKELPPNATEIGIQKKLIQQRLQKHFNESLIQMTCPICKQLIKERFSETKIKSFEKMLPNFPEFANKNRTDLQRKYEKCRQELMERFNLQIEADVEVQEFIKENYCLDGIAKKYIQVS